MNKTHTLVPDDYSRTLRIDRRLFNLNPNMAINEVRSTTLDRCSREGGSNFRAITTVVMIEEFHVKITTYLKADRELK